MLQRGTDDTQADGVVGTDNRHIDLVDRPSKREPTGVNQPGIDCDDVYLQSVRLQLTLPAGWQVVPASVRWDGVTDPGHDEPTVDQMSGPSVAVAWAFSAPVSKDLAGYPAARVAAEATVHPCPTTPAKTTQITIDGQPGLLLARNCEILVLTALTIQNGTAFLFYLQDSSVNAASDPTDEAIFSTILASVRLPK